MVFSRLGDHFASDLVEVHRGCAWSGHDEPLSGYVWYRAGANAVEGKVTEHPLTKLQSLDEGRSLTRSLNPMIRSQHTNALELMTRYIIQTDYNLQCPGRRRHNPREAVPEHAAFLALCNSIEDQQFSA